MTGNSTKLPPGSLFAELCIRLDAKMSCLANSLWAWLSSSRPVLYTRGFVLAEDTPAVPVMSAYSQTSVFHDVESFND